MILVVGTTGWICVRYWGVARWETTLHPRSLIVLAWVRCVALSSSHRVHVLRQHRFVHIDVMRLCQCWNGTHSSLIVCLGLILVLAVATHSAEEYCDHETCNHQNSYQTCCFLIRIAKSAI